MVDYVKYKNSTTLTRKPKKVDSSRYKEYLYGSVEALDMDWADKIVDYNPDLKVDTNGFVKCVNRNVSVSTDCGLDFYSSLNTNEADVYVSNYSNTSNAGSDRYQTQNELQYEVQRTQARTNGFVNRQVVSPQANQAHIQNQVVENTVSSAQVQAYDELQRKYQELQNEFTKLKNDYDSVVVEAQAYRSCQERLSIPFQELDPDVDPKEELESLLDHVYAVMSDTFGPENSVVLSLEQFANVYVNYHNKIQLELASFRGKAEVVDSLEKLVDEKATFDKALEQRDKTIDSLVQELKNSKAEYQSEIDKLKDQLETVNVEYRQKFEDSQTAQEKLQAENQSLTELLTKSRSEYKNLLTDQNHILSQLPLVTVQASAQPTPDSNVQALPTLDPKSETVPIKPLPAFAQDWTASYAKLAVDSAQGTVLTPSSLKAVDKPTQQPVVIGPQTRVKSKPLDNDKFLQSMVQTLYTQNEQAVATLAVKDSVIRAQQDTIRRLQSSLREWESDAVLWLDYVDQSSSLLSH